MRILIADDHSFVRKGIVSILAEKYPHAHFEEVSDCSNLLKKISSKEYAIIISDISMPGRSGLEIVKEIRELAPKTPFLVLSVHSPEEYAVRSIREGASGYLAKDCVPEELISAVGSLLRGKRYITAEIAELLANSCSSDFSKELHESLSKREFQVYKLITSGKSNSNIAEMLSLSVNTISSFRARILEKMHMHSNTELIKYAIEHQII